MKKEITYSVSAIFLVIGILSLIRGIEQLRGGSGLTTKELSAYLKKIDPLVEKERLVMEVITPALQDDSNIHNPAFLEQVRAAKKEFIYLHEEAKFMEVKKKLKERHQNFVESLRLYMEAFRSLEAGLTESDQTKVDEAGDFFQQGAEKLIRVSALPSQIEEKKGRSYVGVWVNASEPHYIHIKEDGTVDDCYGTGSDLMSGVGMKFESGAALNPQDGSLIYKFVWMGDHLMVNGKPYQRGELSQECQNLLALP